MTAKPECRPTELLIASERRYHFFHIAPAGVTLDQVLEPTYWKSVTLDLKRSKWPMIEVVCDDGKWEANLRVYSVGDGFAKTRVLQQWDFTGKAGRKPIAPEGYKIEHIPKNGWRALTPGGEIVAEYLPVEEEAIRAAATHARETKVAA
jgi:hypothetical protein